MKTSPRGKGAATGENWIREFLLACLASSDDTRGSTCCFSGVKLAIGTATLPLKLSDVCALNTPETYSSVKKSSIEQNRTRVAASAAMVAASAAMASSSAGAASPAVAYA